MNRKLEVKYTPVEEITPYKHNAKIHSEEQIGQIRKSIEQFGFNDPIAIDEDNVIIEGHGRLLAAKEMGLTEVPTIKIEGLTDQQKKAYILAHNQLTLNTGFDLDVLSDELDRITDFNMDDFGFDLSDLTQPTTAQPNVAVSLTSRFIVPPFSVLDTRRGYWQKRNKAWKNLGIKSELGRDAKCRNTSTIGKAYGVNKPMSDTSIFDPVLCEVMYKWFSPKEGKVFDCFAGGSVRGIVASKLGYDYVGIDLRQEQIDANYKNAKELGVNPTWHCDDSLNADKYVEDESCDLLFTCPPYGYLEKYSDDPRDISNMTYEEFIESYKKIMQVACRKIKKNRFAVVVVGDFRDTQGYYNDFVSDAKRVMIDEGFKLYNELILIEAVGIARIIATKNFRHRKVTKTHQHVLVFYNGDPSTITSDVYDDIDPSLFEEYIDDYIAEEEDEADV